MQRFAQIFPAIALAFVATAPVARSQDAVWTGGSGTWSDLMNWGGVDPATANRAIVGSNAVVTVPEAYQAVTNRFFLGSPSVSTAQTNTLRLGPSAALFTMSDLDVARAFMSDVTSTLFMSDRSVLNSSGSLTIGAVDDDSTGSNASASLRLSASSVVSSGAMRVGSASSDQTGAARRAGIFFADSFSTITTGSSLALGVSNAARGGAASNVTGRFVGTSFVAASPRSGAPRTAMIGRAVASGDGDATSFSNTLFRSASIRDFDDVGISDATSTGASRAVSRMTQPVTHRGVSINTGSLSLASASANGSSIARSDASFNVDIGVIRANTLSVGRATALATSNAFATLSSSRFTEVDLIDAPDARFDFGRAVAAGQGAATSSVNLTLDTSDVQASDFSVGVVNAFGASSAASTTSLAATAPRVFDVDTISIGTVHARDSASASTTSSLRLADRTLSLDGLMLGVTSGNSTTSATVDASLVLEGVSSVTTNSFVIGVNDFNNEGIESTLDALVVVGNQSSLTVHENAVIGNDASLQFDLVASTWGEIEFSRATTLSGSVHFNFGFTPFAGTSFPLILAPQLSGGFESITSNLPGNVTYRTEIRDFSGSLQEFALIIESTSSSAGSPVPAPGAAVVLVLPLVSITRKRTARSSDARTGG